MSKKKGPRLNILSDLSEFPYFSTQFEVLEHILQLSQVIFFKYAENLKQKRTNKKSEHPYFPRPCNIKSCYQTLRLNKNICKTAICNVKFNGF